MKFIQAYYNYYFISRIDRQIDMGCVETKSKTNIKIQSKQLPQAGIPKQKEVVVVNPTQVKVDISEPVVVKQSSPQKAELIRGELPPIQQMSSRNERQKTQQENAQSKLQGPNTPQKYSSDIEKIPKTLSGIQSNIEEMNKNAIQHNQEPKNNNIKVQTQKKQNQNNLIVIPGDFSGIKSTIPHNIYNQQHQKQQKNDHLLLLPNNLSEVQSKVEKNDYYRSVVANQNQNGQNGERQNKINEIIPITINNPDIIHSNKSNRNKKMNQVVPDSLSELQSPKSNIKELVETETFINMSTNIKLDETELEEGYNNSYVRIQLPYQIQVRIF